MNNHEAFEYVISKIVWALPHNPHNPYETGVRAIYVGPERRFGPPTKYSANEDRILRYGMTGKVSMDGWRFFPDEEVLMDAWTGIPSEDIYYPRG